MLIITYKGYSQNLVPNNSFEFYTNCPQNTNEIYYAHPWFQPNYYDGSFVTSSSTDFYHICSVGIVGIPMNYFGFQFANSGDGYAGIGMYVCYNNDTSCINNNTLTLGREYLEVKLIQALKKQNKYCFSMHVSLSELSMYAVSNFGVFFSKDTAKYKSLIRENMNVLPQIRNPETNIIEDKENWVLISGEYTAEGGEQFITIGNFDTNINTNKKKLEKEHYFAYYYIDDVSVVLCEDTLNPTDTFYLHIPNIFTPNADGQNDAWQVRATGVQQLSAAVYNRWGALLWQQSVEDTTAQAEIKTVWNGNTSTGLPVSAGTYYYLVSYTSKEGEAKKEKGFLTLVR